MVCSPNLSRSISDLGKVSYRSYWKHVLLHLLAEHDVSKDITLKDMALKTGIKTEDIISTLQSLDMVRLVLLSLRTTI